MELEHTTISPTRDEQYSQYYDSQTAPMYHSDGSGVPTTASAAIQHQYRTMQYQEMPLSTSTTSAQYTTYINEPTTFNENYLNVITPETDVDCAPTANYQTGFYQDQQCPTSRTQLRQRTRGRTNSRRPSSQQTNRRMSMFHTMRGQRNQNGQPINGLPGFKVSIPKIRDVNKIDRYSRIVFPVSYMIFNAFYWSFYTL